MPYQTNSDLPDSVQRALTSHAQDIYREAFNHAFQTYKDPKSRQNPQAALEKVAHKVAWSAVKKKYHKVAGQWQEIS